MTESKIRFPSPNESAPMDRFHREMDEVIGLPPPSVKWVTNVYQRSKSGERHCWIALLDNEIIGFADFKVIPFYPGSEQKFARIFDLFITPSVQLCGYGAQLVRKVMRSAIEQGATSIELNVLQNDQINLVLTMENFWSLVSNWNELV